MRARENEKERKASERGERASESERASERRAKEK